MTFSARRSMLPMFPTVIIIARGPSVAHMDIEKLVDKNATIIAINDVAQAVPWADYVFTIDGTRLQERYDSLQNFVGSKVAAIPVDYNLPRPRETIFLKRIKWQPEMRPGYIRTGNSSLGAYEAALQSGAQRVFMLGVDLTGDNTGWMGGSRSTGFSHARTIERFHTVPYVETYNVSEQSRLLRYPKITFKQCMDMLNEKK